MPSTATVVRSHFADVLTALAAQVASVTGLDPSHVLIAAGDVAVPHFQADQDVVLRLMGETPDPDEDGSGRGRVCDLRRRTVVVECRTRVYLDDVAQDVVRLTDASLGHLALEDNAYDAAERWIATDSDGNALALGGFVGAVSDPKPDKDDRNWVSSRFPLVIPYQRALDQSRL